MINKKFILGIFLMVSVVSIMAIKSEAADLGDVNKDGDIDISDASIVLSLIKDSKAVDEEAKEAADVDKNGKINNRDAQIILTYTARRLMDNEVSMEGLLEEINQRKGDANGDGNIDTSDASIILGVTKFRGYYSLDKDIDEDGEITDLDAKYILTYLAKLGAGEECTLDSIVEEASKIFGDVNGDMTIDTSDASEILRMVEDKEEYKEEADIDKNGKVNNRDAQLILKYIAKAGAGEECTLNSVVEEYEKKLGDVNKDGSIDTSDASMVLSIMGDIEEIDEETKVLADVDKNGKINNRDAQIILNYIAKLGVGGECTLNSVVEDAKKMLGDVNGDGSIDTSDASIIIETTKFEEPYYSLSKDIDEDGVITEDDANYVLEYIAKLGAGEECTLNSIVEDAKKRLGDANGDGSIDTSDASEILKMESEEEYKEEADVDKNGKVNKRDAKIISIYVARLGAGNNCRLCDVVEEANEKLGDINKDGEITKADGSRILTLCISKTNGYNILADVNCDGKITISDVGLLMYYLSEDNEARYNMTLYEFTKAPKMYTSNN